MLNAPAARCSWEIRKVYLSVAQQLVERFPNMYGDATFTRPKGGVWEVTFANSKV